MKVQYSKYGFIISIIFAMLGVLSFLVYGINGSYVGEKGILIEYFAFIPIGWLCIFLSIVLGTYWLDIKSFVKLRYSCIMYIGLSVISFVIYHMSSDFVLKSIGFFFAFVAAVCGAVYLARYLVGLLKRT